MVFLSSALGGRAGISSSHRGNRGRCDGFVLDDRLDTDVQYNGLVTGSDCHAPVLLASGIWTRWFEFG